MTQPAPRSDLIAFRAAIGFVWLITGAAVLHPYYRAEGLKHLAPTGLPDWVMHVTCAGEVLLALRIFLWPSGKWITWLQVTVIAAFTLILSATSPELLTHPFGVLSKNVPLVALILTLWELERNGWSNRTRRLLLFGLAFLWIWEGLAPCIITANAQLQEMLVGLSLTVAEPKTTLRILGGVETASGVLLLLLRGRWLLGLLMLQLAGLVAVTVLTTWHDPLLWLHPFGPLTKNVPPIIAVQRLIARLVQDCRRGGVVS